MTAPNTRMLTMLLTFIGSTLGWYAGKLLGTPVAVVGTLLGTAFGYVAARAIVRSLF